MTPRRFLLWVHLTAGRMAGLVILVMSVTGILLAYRRQVINWRDRGFEAQPAPGAQRLPMEDLLAATQEAQGRPPSNITVRADYAAPVAFDFGRERTVFVNPYTGKILGEGSAGLRKFFFTVEDVHRWLGVGAASRASGRAATGACNLIFLILVTTGPFLWWPKQWNKDNLKKIILFRGGEWVRARDWNWHNVLGFWCVVPLFLIVITGVIMSYAWANNLLYRMTGNTPPPPPAAQFVPERSQNSGQRTERGKHRSESPRFDGLEKLFARAEQQVPDYTTISLRLPNPPANALTFSIDRGNGGRPDLRSQLTLDRATGEIVRWEVFSGYNRGRQLRAWARFTHTGEAGGLLGQTMAVIASAGASLLVFTGLSLGVRRFFAWKGRRVRVFATAGS
jgi:uncharacterized iron-regulated membrane protein